MPLHQVVVVVAVAASIVLLACGADAPQPNTAVVANVAGDAGAAAQNDGSNVASASASTSNGGDAAAADESDASALGSSDASTIHYAMSGDGGLAGGRLCGCKLCAPVVSDDPCNTDADCAPEKPCHAQRCIAASNVTKPATPPMCTRIMLCHTTDANACTCLKGKCALAPR